jgi:sodium-dependent dicarboxylate transporter 2/3/5
MRPLEFARAARVLAGPLAFALVWLLLPEHFPDAEGTPVVFSSAGRATLAMTAWMAIWWLTEAVPLEATSLLPVALFPLLGIAGIAEATAPYASDVVFLFLGGFMLAAGLQRWGLDRRIAFAVLARAGSQPAQVLAAVMIATTLLGLWVSNSATAAIMIPIAVSIAGFARFDDEAAAGRFAAALVLAVAYSASIGGMGTLIGTPPNGIAARVIAQETGSPISFAHWSLIAAPPVMLMLLACWWLLARGLPRALPGAAAATRAAIVRARAELGPIEGGARITLAVGAFAAALWITRPLLTQIEFGTLQPFAGLTDPGIAIGAALALFVLPAGRGEPGRAAPRLLDWSSAARLPWGVLVLFGGGLSLAAAIQANGVAEFIAAQSAALAGWPPLLVLVFVLAVTVFLSELTSNTAQAATMIPLLAAMAPALGVEPVLLILACGLGSSCAFMMPVGTPPNAIAFGTGLVTMRQMRRTGLRLNLIAIVVLCVTLALWVPVVYG